MKLKAKKTIHVLITIIIMLVVSRFFVRIIDATVQIDDDIAVLAVLLLLINSVIGFVSSRIYRLLVR